jgi:hypothetical protein
VSPRSPGRIGIGTVTAMAGRTGIETGIAIVTGVDAAAIGIRTADGDGGIEVQTVIMSAGHPETILAMWSCGDTGSAKTSGSSFVRIRSDTATNAPSARSATS